MTAVLFISMVILLILEVPIAFVLVGSSALALVADGGTNLSIIIQRMFSGTGSFTLLAIPFFVLAGNLMSAGGISRRMVNLCNSFLGHIPGGLAMVAVATCAFFAAISGSSAATAAEQSIGELFMAGFLPGLFICATLMAVAHILAKKQGFIPTEKSTGAEKVQSFKEAILAILMPVIILGGIYSGFFTPTEAAVVAVFYGLVVGVFVYREIKIQDLGKIFYDSVITMATVCLIMSASTIFGWILAREQVPQALAQTFLSISSSKYVFLILINIMLLIVGCFCEAGAAMVILAPLLAPIAQTLGIDLIHFGIIMMTNLAIGMMTPPVGVNLYVVCDSAKVKIEGMMKYLMIYFGVLVVDLMIVTFVPPLSLLIPRLFQ